MRLVPSQTQTGHPIANSCVRSGRPARENNLKAHRSLHASLRQEKHVQMKGRKKKEGYLLPEFLNFKGHN